MSEPRHIHWDQRLADVNACYHTDPARAEALTLAVLAELPDEETLRRATGLSLLGSVAFVRGKLAEARERAEEVLVLTQAYPAAQARCAAWQLLGASARRQGDLAAAVRFNQEAVDVALAAADPDLEAVSRNNLGLALAEGGDIDGAMACYLACLERFGDTSPALRRQLHGSLVSNIGLLHRARGDHEAARARFAEGYEAAMAAGNQREAMRVGRNLASTLLTLQRPADAVTLLESLAVGARALGDGQLHLVLAEVCMGQAQLARGAPADALGPLERAVSSMEQMGPDLDQGDYARACALLAEAYAAVGRAEEGLELVRARAVEGGVQGRRELALWAAEVVCLKALGAWEDAVRCLERLRVMEQQVHERVLADQARELRQRLELRHSQEQSERLRLEAERLEVLVAARTADLQASRDQARAGDRAKTAFLAVASHELRTPLNAIVGYAEMVRDGLTDEEPEVLARDLDHVLAAASVLTQHVDRMLAMANLEAGHRDVRLVDVALPALLEGVARRQHRLLQTGGNRIDIDVPEPFVFRSDADLLQGLLDELAQNAVKFTPEGRIQLRGRLMPQDVVIEVEDEGAGIPPEVLARIFEPFGQQDDSTTRRRDGLGLGLTLCRRYAGFLGGALEVVPAATSGSIFRVILPRHP